MAPLFPPYEHQTTRPRGRRFARLRAVPLRLVLPNLVTLLGLCAGLTSMRMALDGRWDAAVYLIVFAAILDGVDGRVARWLKGTSKFGAELDSLADFVNFGVAPAILLYAWALNGIGAIGWIAALLFAIAAGLRLARFNVMADKVEPDWKADFFAGMPAPAGAIVALLPIYAAGVLGIAAPSGYAAACAAYLVLIGFLMVSTVPTYSGKKATSRIAREWVLPVMAAVIAFVALLVSYPMPVLATGTLIYLLSLPAVFVAFRRRERRARAADGEPANPQGKESDPDGDQG